MRIVGHAADDAQLKNTDEGTVGGGCGRERGRERGRGRGRGGVKKEEREMSMLRSLSLSIELPARRGGSRGRTLTLVAENMEEKARWFAALTTACAPVDFEL